MRIMALFLFVALLAALQAPAPVRGQAATDSGAPHETPSRPAPAGAAPATAPATASTAPQSAASATGRTDGAANPGEVQPPHITYAVPAPAQAPWLVRDMIAWIANLALVFVAYFGIILAFFTLRRIERHTRFAEAAAETASNNAQAALSHALSIINSERPWIVITVEPSLSIKNAFNILATNRGRTPAELMATVEQIIIAIDEAHLPPAPAYETPDPGPPPVPIILLTGESTTLKSFSRDDVRALCETEEEYKRLESWDEKVFIYGKVLYRDLIAPMEKRDHETNWCCWYIHGRQKSGLVIAGPPQYNRHT